MPSIKELEAELFLLTKTWELLPPDSFEEEYRRECMEKIIRVQIEAEEFRTGFRRAFLLTKLEKTETDVDGQKVPSYQTTFNWEPLRDRFYNMVGKKEVERIEYYKEEIRKTYLTDDDESKAPVSPSQQPAAA